MAMRTFCLLVLGWIASPTAAQEATHACAGLPDPTARLACYDEAFPLAPGVVEAAMQLAEAGFGLDASTQRPRDGGMSGTPSDPGRLESRIERVSHGRGTERSFHLVNGQVWAQAEARSTGQVRAGDTVEVRKGLLGSYQLVTPAGVFLRVRRVR